MVIEQLTQLFHSIVQFFRIGKNRLRITFVQRMNKAQQYLLHHVLVLLSFCAFNNTKWLVRAAQYALICNSSIQTRLRLMVWIPSYIDFGIRVSLLAANQSTHFHGIGQEFL